MRGRNAWIALFVLGLVLLVLVLRSAFPGTIQDQGSQVQLAYAIGLLVMVGSSIILGYRGTAMVALKQAVAWVGIFVFIIVLYSYRFELQELGARVTGEIIPSRPASSNGEVVLYQSRNGHFIADGLINGKRTRFLVDTGATDVALTIEDAERAGIDTRRLTFNVPYNTANGISMGAKVRIQKIEIGDVVVYDVDASVLPANGGGSLLGMSFLNRLSSFEVRGNRLILRK